MVVAKERVSYIGEAVVILGRIVLHLKTVIKLILKTCCYSLEFCHAVFIRACSELADKTVRGCGYRAGTVTDTVVTVTVIRSAALRAVYRTHVGARGVHMSVGGDNRRVVLTGVYACGNLVRVEERGGVNLHGEVGHSHGVRTKLTVGVITPYIYVMRMCYGNHMVKTYADLIHILEVYVVVRVLLACLIIACACCGIVGSALAASYLNRCNLIRGCSVAELCGRVVAPCPYSTVGAESRAGVAKCRNLGYVVKILAVNLILCRLCNRLSFLGGVEYIYIGVITKLTLIILTPSIYITVGA